MMLLLTLVSALGVLCCPPTLPVWLFMLVGCHTSVRHSLRRRYVETHGAAPRLGSRDWFLVYL